MTFPHTFCSSLNVSKFSHWYHCSKSTSFFFHLSYIGIVHASIFLAIFRFSCLLLWCPLLILFLSGIPFCSCLLFCLETSNCLQHFWAYVVLVLQQFVLLDLAGCLPFLLSAALMSFIDLVPVWNSFLFLSVILSWNFQLSATFLSLRCTGTPTVCTSGSCWLSAFSPVSCSDVLYWSCSCLEFLFVPVCYSLLKLPTVCNISELMLYWYSSSLYYWILLAVCIFHQFRNFYHAGLC